MKKAHSISKNSGRSVICNQFIALVDDNLPFLEKLKSAFEKKEFKNISIYTQKSHPIELAVKQHFRVIIADREMPDEKNSQDAGIELLVNVSDQLDKSKDFLWILYTSNSIPDDDPRKKQLEEYGIVYMEKQVDEEQRAIVRMVEDFLTSLLKNHKLGLFVDNDSEEEMPDEKMISITRVELEILIAKAHSFDDRVKPYVEWLKKDKNKNNFIEIDGEKHFYPQIAEDIRSGVDYALKMANDHLELERKRMERHQNPVQGRSK